MEGASGPYGSSYYDAQPKGRGLGVPYTHTYIGRSTQNDQIRHGSPSTEEACFSGDHGQGEASSTPSVILDPLTTAIR